MFYSILSLVITVATIRWALSGGARTVEKAEHPQKLKHYEDTENRVAFEGHKIDLASRQSIEEDPYI